MPQIPVYRQQTLPQGSASPGQTYSGAVLGGVARLGAAVQGVENELERQKVERLDNEERRRQADALTRIHADVAARKAELYGLLEERKRTATDGAKGFTVAFQNDFQEVADGIRKRALTPEAKAVAEDQLGRLQADLTFKAQQFEAETGIRHRWQLYSDALDSSQIELRAAPEKFEEVLATNREVLRAAELPADMIAKAWRQTKDKLGFAATLSLVERNPVDTLKRLRAAPGESGVSAIEVLSPDSRERLMSTAETEIRRREAEARAAAAEARAAAAARAGLLKDETENAIRQYKLGFGLPQNFGELVAEVNRLPDDDPRKLGMRRDLAVLNALDDNGFLSLTPTQQKNWATALETDIREKGANPASILMLETAKDIQGESERRAKADPFRFVVERGIVKPPEQTGDVLADLTARAAAGRQASAYLGKPVPGFTAEELDNLAARYQAGGVEDRLGILNAINQTHGEEQASAVYAELDKKNQGVMALAGVLLGEGGDFGKLVVRGQVAAKETPGLLPSPNIIQPELDATLRDAYGLGTSARRSVEGAVKAAYAALSADAGDLSGEVDKKRLRVAVDAVTGGLVMFKGRTYPGPKRGVTQDQFASWAGSLGSKDFAGVAGITPEDAERVYKADGSLVGLGPNRYGIAIEGLDGTYLLRDANDNPLTVSYADTKPLPLKTRDPEARPSLEWSP